MAKLYGSMPKTKKRKTAIGTAWSRKPAMPRASSRVRGPIKRRGNKPGLQ